MKVKNIVLTIIIISCFCWGYFTIKSKLNPSRPALDQYVYKTQLVCRWLKGKNVEEAWTYLDDATLNNCLKDEGIVSREPFVLPDSADSLSPTIFDQFLQKAIGLGVKAIVVTSSASLNKSANNLETFLQRGGVLFIRNMDSVNFNGEVYEVLIKYMKLGRVAADAIKPGNYPDGLSAKETIAAIRFQFDETNVPEFSEWYNKIHAEEQKRIEASQSENKQ